MDTQRNFHSDSLKIGQMPGRASGPSKQVEPAIIDDGQYYTAQALMLFNLYIIYAFVDMVNTAHSHCYNMTRVSSVFVWFEFGCTNRQLIVNIFYLSPKICTRLFLREQVILDDILYNPPAPESISDND